MDLESRKFLYNPLGPQKDAFRLLTLKKGADMRLEAEISHTTIQEAHDSYEAVSYTWGNAKAQDVLHIGDMQLGITCNLSLVLRDLRRPDSDRDLWVDAICINQNDLSERGRQVQQMRSIFFSARLVLFCVGRPTEFSDFLLDSLNEIGTQVAAFDQGKKGSECPSHIHNNNSSGKLLESTWRNVMRELGRNNYMARHRIGVAFTAITAESWFRRVWIIQEVANAREGIVCCGRKTVSASLFAKAGRVITSLGDGSIHPAARPILDLMWRSQSSSLRLRRERSLYELVTTFSAAEATDQYDNIYALLGIATNPSSLTPDYTIGPRDVMENTIRSICGSTEHFAESPPFDTIREFVEDLSRIEHPQLIHWAARNGYLSVVRFLLDKGAYPALLFGSEREPLYVASKQGHASIVELLLGAQYVNHNEMDEDGRTALYWAAMRGHHTVCELLLATGLMKVNLPDKKGTTPFLVAARAGHDRVAELLLATGQVDLTQRDGQGETALLTAAKHGHEPIVKLLLGSGHVGLISTAPYGGSALFWAAENGHHAVVGLLLESGLIDLNAADMNARSAWYWAEKHGHTAVCKHLRTLAICEVVKSNP